MSDVPLGVQALTGWPRPIIYDIEQKRPACVLIQAAAGCGLDMASAFDSQTWLTFPTDGMRRVMVESREQLVRLVEITEADYRKCVKEDIEGD